MKVFDCYSMGNVVGSNKVGGLIGSTIGLFKNCYSIGSASGIDEVGGLVGKNNDNGVASYCMLKLCTV